MSIFSKSTFIQKCNQSIYAIVACVTIHRHCIPTTHILFLLINKKTMYAEKQSMMSSVKI